MVFKSALLVSIRHIIQQHNIIILIINLVHEGSKCVAYIDSRTNLFVNDSHDHNHYTQNLITLYCHNCMSLKSALLAPPLR